MLPRANLILVWMSATGALKINEQMLSDYYVTQPYMEAGFQIITKSYPVEPVALLECDCVWALCDRVPPASKAN